MDQESSDKAIEFAEKKVLLMQTRILEQTSKALDTIRRLEVEAKDLEEMKSEWIKKKNKDHARIQSEAEDLAAVHRSRIDEMRIAHERELDDKFRDIKNLIQDKEKELEEMRKRRDSELLITREKESSIKAKFQQRISDLLKEEQNSVRRGIVRQKRLFDVPGLPIDITSEANTKKNKVCMKTRAPSRRRNV